MSRKNPIPPTPGRNIHIYPSDLLHESRMLRIARTLSRNRIAAPVCLVGIQKGGAPERETIDSDIRIWRVPVKKYRVGSKKLRRFLRYASWLSRIYAEYSRQPLLMVNCHSIFDLPVGVLLKRKTRCLLVYDTHELESERNGLKGVMKIACKMAERILVPSCDQIFTVSDSIGDWYKRRYPDKRVQTILNIPSASGDPAERAAFSLRSGLGIPAEHTIFLYLGLLNFGRGLDLMIKVFSAGPGSRHLVLIGYGPLFEPIRQRVQSCPNIHLLDAVPPDRVQAAAASADVGLVLIEKTCLSYYYCLPNKLFEFRHAGIPCIVSDFPEMSRFARNYSCGWKTAVDEDSFARLLGGLSRAKIAAMSRALHRSRKPPCWENEEKKLLAAYADLLARESG